MSIINNGVYIENVRAVIMCFGFKPHTSYYRMTIKFDGKIVTRRAAAAAGARDDGRDRVAALITVQCDGRPQWSIKSTRAITEPQDKI